MDAFSIDTPPDSLPVWNVATRPAGFFRRSRRIAVVAILGVSAMVLPVTIAHADNHDDSDGRPMDGHCTTTFAFTSPTVIHLEGTCRLRNIGSVTVVASQTATPLDNGTLFITNTAVYTTTRGDQLNANFVGVGVFASQTNATFSGTETYRGGTGRFADALGSVALSGSATFTSPTGGVGEFTTLGTISF